MVGQKDAHCSANDRSHNQEPYRWPELLCSGIVCTFIALCLLADYSDNELLRLFSVKQNLRKIYKIPDDHDSNDYAFLHGFKAIYVALSAMAHACAILYLFCPSLYASARTLHNSNAVFRGMLKRTLLGPDIAVFISGVSSLCLILYYIENQYRDNLNQL